MVRWPGEWARPLLGALDVVIAGLEVLLELLRAVRTLLALFL